MTKWSEFSTTDTAPTSDDQIIVLNAPGGTPGSRKVTLADLGKGLPSVAGVLLADESSDTTCFMVFATGATGAQGL